MKYQDSKGTNTTKFNSVSWMAQNHVAANMLMLLLVISGVYYLQHIRQEIQPNYTFSTVIIDMSYPGASPEEVEENIVLAIEAAIKNIEGLSRISSTASEGKALINADIEAGEPMDRVLQNVRNAVDGITSFPTDAERPNIRLDDDARWLTTIGVTGEASETTLYDVINRIKSDLLAIDGVIQVIPRVKKEPEISIEVPSRELSALQLTLSDIADAIGEAVKDIPSGNIETREGQYVLRTEGRKTSGTEFARIPLKSEQEGGQILLGDVAQIKDGFKQSSSFFSYNGRPGMIVYVYQSKNARTVELAKDVHGYVEALNRELPDSITVELPYKRVEKFNNRMGMLVENGVAGLLLVLLVLGIFLNPRLAFWVAVSIPVVFIGSFSILYFLGVSINMISMFAFIMSLGIVVDDAIIVGESIYQKRQLGMPAGKAASEGAKDMAMPVLFAVGTNILAFVPLLMMPGDMGQYLRSLPIVAVVVFAVSMIEALFILPAHLNTSNSLPNWTRKFKRTILLRQHVAIALDRFRDNQYADILKWSIRHRYAVLVIFTGCLLIMYAWFYSSRIEFNWYPQIPSERVSARITMPVEAPAIQTIEISKKIEAAGLQAILELGTLDDLQNRSVSAAINNPTGSIVTFELVDEENREFSQQQFVNLWREKVGHESRVETLTFDYLVGFGRGAGVYVDMRHGSNVVLENAASELADIMRSMEGLADVTDGLAQGKNQLKYELTAEAKTHGLTEKDLGRQLRAAFYGDEAVRFLRDLNEVKVWVRLPRNERDSLMDVGQFVIRTPSGVELPLSQAAAVNHSKTFTAIQREGGRRNISVGGVVVPDKGNRGLITKSLEEQIIPDLKARYPGLKIGMSGSLNARSGQSTTDTILHGLGLVCIAIFALMASLFRSYIQGLIIILTIPFCIAAAVFGHILMGYSLTANSMFGMVALAGMVVNGSLVLTSQINRLRTQGVVFSRALLDGSLARFRPIVLTSFTTAIGLLPMLFETATQALFLVPFAIALSFGTVMSTLVVLILIPVLHAIHYDFSTNAGTTVMNTIESH